MQFFLQLEFVLLQFSHCDQISDMRKRNLLFLFYCFFKKTVPPYTVPNSYWWLPNCFTSHLCKGKSCSTLIVESPTLSKNCQLSSIFFLFLTNSAPIFMFSQRTLSMLLFGTEVKETYGSQDPFSCLCKVLPLSPFAVEHIKQMTAYHNTGRKDLLGRW